MEAQYKKLRVLETIIFICCLSSHVNSRDTEDLLIAKQSTTIFRYSMGCLARNASNSFRNNLNLLLTVFNQQSSIRNYYNTSIGNNSDQVYGYYTCRADVGLDICSGCIVNGTQIARESSCINDDNGDYFSQLCMFRYANYGMYGSFEDSMEGNVSNYKQFNKTLSLTFESLINETAFGSKNNGSRLRFASVENRVTDDETIYSLAQCTPDIAGANCSRCLESGVSYLSGSANGSLAAYALLNKCFIGYDNVSFYDIGYSNTGVVLRSSNLLAVYCLVFIIFGLNFLVLF